MTRASWLIRWCLFHTKILEHVNLVIGPQREEMSVELNNDKNKALPLTALRNASLGAVGGLVYTLFSEYFARKGKIMPNRYVALLPITTEGMEMMPDLCKMWYSLWIQYGAFDEKDYKQALKDCDRLCVLATVVPPQLENLGRRLSKKERSKDVNQQTIRHFSQWADELTVQIDERLDALYLAVRESEKALWSKKDQAQRQFAQDTEQWEKDVHEWKITCAKIEEDHSEEQEVSLSSLLNSDNKGDEWKKKCPPEPTKPSAPTIISVKLQSEVADQYNHTILDSCRQLRQYVEKVVEQFIRDNKSKL